MPARNAHFLAVSLLASLFACGSSDPSTPSPSPSPAADAGPSPRDAGQATQDATSPMRDAGPADTGTGMGPRPDASTVIPGGVRFVGRVDTSNPNAPKFAWSGSGLVATVSGTKVSAKLTSEGSDAFYQPVIDGKVLARFSIASGVTQTVTLGDGLAAGDHTVEIYRDSEGMYGDSVFLGFVDGTLKGAPAGSGRRIEVVGDSISAGYGNLGNEVHPPWDNSCTFSLDTEAAYQSYASILARTLDAEVSIIARSGWGMVRDLGGSPAGVLSSVYGNTLGTNATPAWSFATKPDVVLINLGTNDSGPGDPGAAFETAYVAFLKVVRGHYPDAHIFLTFGTITADPMLTTMRTHLTNVIAAAADPKVTAIPMGVQDATSTGCDYHPNVAEDQKMASALAPTIKAALGW